ncbi:hypothetical protein [Lewinella sp. LCG006]|uniref:hypothetical protein n=1 Tax=Lewinella sp. LCG006 TaxID=3231911 RepID=UPI00345FF0F3
MKQLLRILPLVALLAFSFSNANAAVFAINDASNKAFLESQFGTDNLEDFVHLSAKDVAARTGERLSLKEKLVLKVVQRQVKRQLKKGERVDLKSAHAEAGTTVNLGGFLLGLLLGLLGVLIALLIDRDLVTSALYGLLVLVVILVIGFVL